MNDIPLEFRQILREAGFFPCSSPQKTNKNHFLPILQHPSALKIIQGDWFVYSRLNEQDLREILSEKFTKDYIKIAKGYLGQDKEIPEEAKEKFEKARACTLKTVRRRQRVHRRKEQLILRRGRNNGESNTRHRRKDRRQKRSTRAGVIKPIVKTPSSTCI